MQDSSLLQWNAAGLIASVIWGGLGMGFFVYGRKQRFGPGAFGRDRFDGHFFFYAELGHVDESGRHRHSGRSLLLVAAQWGIVNFEW